MATLKPLDPAPATSVPPLDFVVTEAGRSEFGLVATVQVLNGGLLAARTVKLANPRDRANFAEELAGKTSIEVPVLDATLLELLAMTETALRSASARPKGGADSNVYEVSPDGLFRVGPDGARTQLTNFNAKIVGDLRLDDGAVIRREFEMEAALRDQPLPSRFTIPSEKFPHMTWPIEQLGPQAIVSAGFGAKDHARAAIQRISGSVDTRTIYTHTGWRKHAGEWVFMFNGGAIGKDGILTDARTALPEELSKYVLPAPPEGAPLADVVRSSVDLVTMADLKITVPGFAAIWRAVLGAPPFSVHYCGPTGAGKTEWVARLQQHFGPEMDAEALPENWESTPNEVEALSFHAKDVLLAVDDFAPTGSLYDVQRKHREADRLLRAVANRQGRGRLKSDTGFRARKKARGLILSTGEDIPRGQSLRARIFTVEMTSNSIDWEKMSEAQRRGADGVYAAAMAAFIKWVAGRFDQEQQLLVANIEKYRARAATGAHRRTPMIVAHLMSGIDSFLRFAVDVGALEVDDAETCRGFFWDALGEASKAQPQHLEASDPALRFIELLRSGISSGAAHVASPKGGPPDGREKACGWRASEDSEWKPQGRRVGWIEGDALYLDADAALGVVQELAHRIGENIPVTPHTLRKRLRERQLLASMDDNRGVLTVRRTLEDSRRDVLHLAALKIFPPNDPIE
jgi:hypothetical protein